SVPQLAIWDDHDYGLGDGDRTFPGKEASTAVFREYWANPRYGLAGGTGMSQTPRASQTPRVSQTPRLSQTPGASQTPGVPQKPGVPQTPGVFFRWSIGDVDFFLLDGRTFRDPNALPDGPGKTQLGVRQKRWLKSGLKKSRAVFKVLVSPGAWTEGKGPGGDSWASFLHERDELFDFIRDEGVTGVFLLAGDAHRPQMNVIPRSARGGYDLYEVISSPLAQTVERGKLGRGEKGGFRRVRPPNAYVFNFGLLEFDTAAAPPRVTIRLIDAEGKSLWRPLVLTAEDLKPGARSRDRTVRD
ncbi:MAG: alkaline phosphatase D family protein, partial [Nitrospinota bacterium]